MISKELYPRCCAGWDNEDEERCSSCHYLIDHFCLKLGNCTMGAKFEVVCETCGRTQRSRA